MNLEWISVKDDLPAEESRVLVETTRMCELTGNLKYSHHEILEYSDSKFWIDDHGCRYPATDVLYWMPEPSVTDTVMGQEWIKPTEYLPLLSVPVLGISSGIYSSQEENIILRDEQCCGAVVAGLNIYLETGELMWLEIAPYDSWQWELSYWMPIPAMYKKPSWVSKARVIKGDRYQFPVNRDYRVTAPSLKVIKGGLFQGDLETYFFPIYAS